VVEVAYALMGSAPSSMQVLRMVLLPLEELVVLRPGLAWWWLLLPMVYLWL